MKKVLFALFCAATILSCSNDDELQLTKVNGKPSRIVKSTDEKANIYFSYQGNRLSKIKAIGGSILSYSYENNELVSVSTSPEDKRVADGNGQTSFTKENSNKICIESWGEPSFHLFRKEIELDENNTPIKITDIGIFDHIGPKGEISKIEEGQYYGLFTYDQTTKNLTRLVVYDKTTSKEIATYEYEYDDNTGAISKIDLPLWFYAHKAYGNRDYRTSYSRLFFNYSNNLIKETVTLTDNTPQATFHYIYQYNKDSAPVSIQKDESDMDKLSITY
ncbi:MAG: hypothetical protein LBV74_22410 [Tannerella sp.]|jgi:hypothetical protein|nr:hypothetical protein [Tannerella sp.]